MKYVFRLILLGTVLGLVCDGALQSAWAASPAVSSDTFSRDMLSSGLGYPPYKIEISVKSVHGEREVGTADLLRDCLKENLSALGEVKFVEGSETEKSHPDLRLRVWFTEVQRPEGYEGFDMTVAVVVGKIMKGHPEYEAVLDAYSLAGIEERDLERLCNDIAVRLDLKVLSVLRAMRKHPK